MLCPIHACLQAVADDGLRTHSGPLGRLTSYTHEAGDTYDIATNTASATMRRWTTAGGAARTTTSMDLDTLMGGCIGVCWVCRMGAVVVAGVVTQY